MIKLLKLAAIPLVLMTTLGVTAHAEEGNVADTNYEEKLPYMFKDPNWEKYKNNDTGKWPLPKAPAYSTGLYSMASNNSIDYKEDQNKFYDTASKYKSSGNSEVYYKSNPSTSVTMATPGGSAKGKSVGGDTTVEYTFSDTNTPAYNNTVAANELVLDSSQGQWLVTNGYFSRDNLASGVKSVSKKDGVVISSSALESNPWGLDGPSTYITPEDFLMGLSKSIYGVIQSRPIYVQTTPNRLAKKVTWEVKNPKYSDGKCGPITWKYKTTGWKVQDVSNVVPNWKNTSAPACGQSKIIDRGEYIVHPEGYLNNVWYRYHEDQNSFVSANVYELYFSKLLQKGILTTDAAFANATPTTTFTPDSKNKSTAFSFTKNYSDRFFSEYHDFGKSADASSKYKYPVWATELGALYTNRELSDVPFGSNLTDKAITITKSGGSNQYEKALGIGYSLVGNTKVGITDIKPKQTTTIMAKNTVTVIDALQLIERAMRVEDGDMSNTEADIVTKKYGAQYLDVLNSNDRQTVSYLLAKGVLNFENYQEYSNLYSPLSQSFAYKLIYRITNEDARLKFTEVTLTDSVELPSLFSEYKQSIVKADLAKLSILGSLTGTGTLIKNETSNTLTLMSDINFLSNSKRIDSNASSKINTRYVITADMDDPLKYLYRSMPLVNVSESGNPYASGNDYVVYTSATKKLYNNRDDSLKRYVGIDSITKNANTGRYSVVFYAYGDSYENALTFIKANLTTRIDNVTTKSVETSVVSEESGAMSSTKGSDLNSSIATNNDLITNTDFDLTAYSNSKTSIVGNSLVPGASAVKVGDKTMASLTVVSKLTDTTAFETIGSKPLVSVDSSQLKGTKVNVTNSAGEVVGKTTILKQKIKSRKSAVNKNTATKKVVAHNISMLKSTDTIITDRTFKYTDKEGKPRKVKGSVVVSWNLDLPTEAEQNSLVGSSVTPYVNDGAKSSWVFTKPVNKSLLNVWNYNLGLNNALLKTLSGNNLTVASGYFSPTVDILVDSLNSKETTSSGKTYNRDLSTSQLRQIENNFTAEVGKNLSATWVKSYVGSVALANHIVGTKVKDGTVAKEIKKYTVASKSNSKATYVKPPGMLRGTAVPVGKTVWSELVFNRGRATATSSTYLDKHSHKSKLNLDTIYTTAKGNSFYGEFMSSSGEGIIPYLSISYVKDNYGKLYKTTENSEYTYTGSILREDTSNYNVDHTGKKITYKGEEWFVAEDNPYIINLYSKKYISAVKKKGELYQNTSGAKTAPTVLRVIKALNIKTFGKGQEKGIDSAAYLRTQSFDFLPGAKTIKEGTKFIGISNGSMTPYVYKTIVDKKGKPGMKVTKTTLNDGQLVQVPEFVTLSKAVWSISTNKLVWSKKYVGADPELYTKGSLVQGMKEQLLKSESKNLVSSQNVKTGTLTVGKTSGVLTGRNVTFAVPYSIGMMKDGKLNSQAVLDSFNRNADLTVTSKGETASSAQYVTNKKVGSYDTNYKKYSNTLVDNKGKLQVATGTKLIDYTPSTVIDSVSLTGIVMSGVRFLNNGASSSSNSYKIYQYQTVKPPAIVAPFTEGAPPLLNADSSIVADVASNFEGLPTALDLFDSLQDYMTDITVKNAWFLVVVSILGLSVLLSITTLLAHVFAHTPISNYFFERILDVTGIDFLAIISVGTVRIAEGIPNNWIRTLKTSLFLGVVPIVIFGVMQVYGMV